MTGKLYRDRDWLYEMYWKQKKNLKEIAGIAGCSMHTIHYWMTKFSIPRRLRSQTEGLCHLRQNPKWLEAMHRVYQDPGWRKNVTEANRRRFQAPEYCGRHAEVLHRLHQDPKWLEVTRQKLAEAQCRLALKKRGRGEMTDIEAICYTAFESLGLEFVFEKFIKRYRVDFFFPSHGIVIEAMGRYWHEKPNRRKKDIERKEFLEACGYTVLEWWDSDIKADVWQLIDKQLLPLLDQPSRIERPPHGVSKPYKGPHGWESAIQLYLFGKEQED